MQLNSGNTGDAAEVNRINELLTFSVTETETESAIQQGLGHNINTGDITVTSAAASLLYVKNQETEDLIVNLTAFGMRGFTNLTDMAVITIIRNPTGGDIISDATDVDMRQNLNFGSNKTLSAETLSYKGKNSGTITGGDSIVQFYQGNNSRLAAPIGFELPKGSSIGIKLVATGSTAGTMYAALVLHKKDPRR